MRAALHLSVLVGVALTACTMHSVGAMGDQGRDAFLNRMDQALASRDANAILALCGLKAWQAAGYPTPNPAAITLPSAPLKRLRDLSESEVLYEDGVGRKWRLSLERQPDGGLAAVLHDRACPRGGIVRSPEWEAPTRGPQSAPTWTPLECWPLPR